MTAELNDFPSLKLAAPLLSALAEMNFHTPSPIQAKTIPYMLAGQDVIALAQTGTGKTAAFALPCLHNLQANKKHTQVLVLAPTRELAIQVADQFTALSAKMPAVTVAVLCGGQEYRRQLTQLRQGAQVVVGTPGRILDHIDRGTLDLSSLSTFILDEADEMLRMGFIEDVETILAKLPGDKHMALFSATMPYRIREIANRYLKDAQSVEIRGETATVKAIEQKFLFATPPQKPDALLRILAVEDYQGVMVFVRTKTATEEVATYLQQQGLRSMAIHGDITQALRERIIAQFRQGVIDVLVATDVAARGLDVERVTHVINYDVPHDSETYVHRIGRTGRAGRSGVTILFVTPRESRILNTIERHTRQKIEKISVPNDHQIQEVKQKQFLAGLTERLSHAHLRSYREVLEGFAKSNGIDPLDLAAALALQLNQDKPWRQEFPKAAAKERIERFHPESKERSSKFERKRDKIQFDSQPRRERRSFGAAEEASQELFRIEVGRKHGVKPGNIVGAIANEAGLQSRFISGLTIHDEHSTVKLPKGMSKEVMQILTKVWVCGRQMKLSRVRS